MQKKLAIVIASVALLAGCTTSLETRPTSTVTALDQALPNHAYSLPMLQYEIVVGYKLVSCPGSIDAQGKPTKLAFKVETIAASDHVAGESYTIDYSALSSTLKTTDFSIEAYERTGTLKAINASAEDKTADAVKSAIELGIAGASMAAGNPLPAIGFAHAADDGSGTAADALLAQAEMDSVLTCTPKAIGALASATAARAEIKRLNALIAPAVRRIEAISLRAGIKLSDSGDAKALLAIHDAQLINLDALADQQATLQDLDKELTFVETRTWPIDPYVTEGRIGMSGALGNWLGQLIAMTKQPTSTYDAAVLNTLFTAETKAKRWQPEFAAKVRTMLDAALNRQNAGSLDSLCKNQTLQACLEARLDVHAELLAAGGPVTPCAGAVARSGLPCLSKSGAIAARSGASHKGVFFRQPIRAKLLLCDRGRTCRDGDRDALLRTGWDVAPQLGQLRFAPLTNSTFQNNALSLAIREDGTLIKFQYTEKSAVLAQTLATAATVATKVDEERVARQKERRQALLDRRADITYERSEVSAVRNEAAAVRTDELANLQYQYDKVVKEKALLDQRFPPAKADPVVVTEFLNETTRLEAMATQLSWRIAIKEAEEKLGK